jgi:MspA protein
VRVLVRSAMLAATLLVIGGGVAHADPVPVADVAQSADTDDGWHVTAALSKMTVNSVPNMAATALTREGFVTGEASATISGDGKSPVNSGEVILGVQLGCQVDLSQGGNFSLGGDAGVAISPGGGRGLITGLGPTAYADIDPSISINILPGNITTMGLGKKALKGRNGEITVHDAHVKVDGCGGPVVIRFFAYAGISTDIGDDSINTYGDILTL